MECRGTLRTAEDMALLLPELASGPAPGRRGLARSYRTGCDANEACRLDILARLRGRARCRPSELPDTCAGPWRSSGWNNHKNVTGCSS